MKELKNPTSFLQSNQENLDKVNNIQANKIFSFGRDHGFYGRIYSQTVICEPSLSVFHPTPSTTKVVGVAFTPQDGNSLMSSVAMCLYGIHGKKALHGRQYIPKLKEMMLQHV